MKSRLNNKYTRVNLYISTMKGRIRVNAANLDVFIL